MFNIFYDQTDTCNGGALITANEGYWMNIADGAASLYDCPQVNYFLHFMPPFPSTPSPYSRKEIK